jgi:hypothetical protein
MCHLDPRVDLTEEQRAKLIDMVKAADASVDDPTYRFGLSSDSFAVSFIHLDPLQPGDPFPVVDPSDYPEIVHIYSMPGSVGIWRREDPIFDLMKWYKDDMGVHEFLAELAAPAIAKHHADMWVMISTPWDPPPWEPNF